jgi:hypothetical protein
MYISTFLHNVRASQECKFWNSRHFLDYFSSDKAKLKISYNRIIALKAALYISHLYNCVCQMVGCSSQIFWSTRPKKPEMWMEKL